MHCPSLVPPEDNISLRDICIGDICLLQRTRTGDTDEKWHYSMGIH